ncbi:MULTISPECIES: conjugal transfer protein TrbL family protein [unclassified Breznakia]|uniref:conjugal transfer protein TrbL family protein n=1 Tax=unclassified Breznakia TaxID=2623764 RepID=UPI002476E54D|nr:MULTISPECIES: conjugal transfer protein TrbL family protein [unclassified Breznakia]MDH6367392.1 hypothetical protein [Breznakia sp. PH1-1]MDH6403924.1 hypothetical protein [Breznakia sp. PF1-11]MDH6411633.1 hypothetical protein [Breznakia sp. PFB1-11]MDH6414559.1 hypothetical protein [Breznakia sp. PFB1-14]MDH6418665.1 hypothetical protein [Breznakia sp. PFB1-12]
MDILYLDFFGIGETIQDFVRGIFWGAIKILMDLIQGIIEALINGVLMFPILENTYVDTAYKTCVALMFIILGPKIIYEVVTSALKDDEANLDFHKKTTSTVLGVIIAVTLSITVPYANKLSTQVITSLTSSTSTSVTIEQPNVPGTNIPNTLVPEKTVTLGDTLISSVFQGFGGMPQNGTYGANNLATTYQTDEFDIYERHDSGENEDEYVWDFSELMVLVGMLIYLILLAMIIVQVATRVMAIGFYYIIGPLCCLSMTNYQNPQAFTVWKNSLIGQFMMNVGQIFLLGLFSSLVGSISNLGISSGLGGITLTVAQLVMYFGGFSLIISMPPFIQSMIGGYGSGVMETMNQIRGGMAMAKGATVGLVAGAVSATAGKRNSFTGNRQGGLRGAIAGNKKQDGTRYGGIVGNTVGHKNNNGDREGGLRGAFAGDVTTNRSDGSQLRTGGVMGALRGSKESSADEQGNRNHTYTGGLRGALAGNTSVTRNQDGTTIRNRSGGFRGAVTRNNAESKHRKPPTNKTSSHKNQQSFRGASQPSSFNRNFESTAKPTTHNNGRNEQSNPDITNSRRRFR